MLATPLTVAVAVLTVPATVPPTAPATPLTVVPAVPVALATVPVTPDRVVAAVVTPVPRRPRYPRDR